MQQVLRNMEYFREYLAYQQRREQREAHRRRREQRMSRSLPEASASAGLPPPPPPPDAGSESEPDANRPSRRSRNAARMRRRLSHDISEYQARVRAACAPERDAISMLWRSMFSW